MDPRLRSLLLAAGLQHCANVIERVRSSGLTDGQITEVIPVEGSDWKVTASYCSHDDSVTGRIISVQTGSVPAPLRAMGFSVEGADPWEVQWSFPAEWALSAAHRPIQAGGS